MKYDLNWDEANINGVIQNDNYPTGVLFEGISKKPDLGFQYDWFMYYETQDHYVIHKDGTLQAMTAAQRLQIQTLAINWVQAEGDEGNPTLQQMKDEKIYEMQTEVVVAVQLEYDTGDGFVITTDEIMMDQLHSHVVSSTGGDLLGADNTLHTASANDVKRYNEEIHTNHAIARQYYFTKAAEIHACTTKPCVSSIAW